VCVCVCVCVCVSPYLPNMQSALCPLWLYNIFHIITKTARFPVKFIKRKTCFFLSTNHLPKTFINKRRNLQTLESVLFFT